VLAGLDADQAVAAESVDGSIAVIAGPGSGKTRMLTHRLAHLVLERNVPAASCLAITFTRKATEELQARLAVLLPKQAGQCAVHSFHSLGLSILRAHGSSLGLASDFRIADEAERRAALAKALGVSESRAGRLLRTVSVLKRSGKTGVGEGREALAALARLSREGNWVDFDDLVVLAVDLLERNPEIAAEWRGRYRHIVADEFQDVDEQQYRLLQLLAAPDGNLCVIGDPHQAIYGFRGADAACFERFTCDFPAVPTLRLTRNYRSTADIVTASAKLIGAPPDGIIRPKDQPVTLHVAASEADEAEFVAATIEELLGGHDLLSANRKANAKKDAAPLGFADFAVLYRTDAQAAAFSEAFDRAGIPFKKSSPAPLATHAGVQAILRALDEMGGNSLSERLIQAVETAGQAGVNAAELSEAKGWLTALADSDRVSGSEMSFREQIALSTEADFRDPRADRVSLLTMHAAKGLEFSVVFVVGLEDGVMPFSFGGDDREEGREAEERRLLYVAMTRAKDRLFLSRSSKRFWRGEVRALPPSPYLAELTGYLSSRPASPVRRKAPQQYSLF